MTESITTAAPVVETAIQISDSDADISFMLSEELRTLTPEGSTYFILEAEDRVWQLT